MRQDTLAVFLASVSALVAVPGAAQTIAAAASQDNQLQAAGGPAANAPEANQPGDIIVTAQRRSERVQDVPISISVVSSAQLDRQQVSQLTDLSKSSASLNFGGVNNAGGGGGGAFIRGIGTAALTRSAESAVGVVVDGVVQGNTNISNLFDISRVEVLRGPQGTLFGQSVSAGVINITTTAPDPSRISGKVTAELSGDGFAGSEFGKQVIRGGINLPVSDTSALRVSAYGGRTTGVTRDVYTGQNDRLEEAGIRARYMGEFGRVTVNLIGDYNYSLGKDGQWYSIIAANPGWASIFAQCGVNIRPGNTDHCSDPAVNRQRAVIWGGSGQIDVDLGAVTLTSITAYRESHIFAGVDIDRTPLALNPPIDIPFVGPTDYNQFTQEVRVASDPAKPLSVTLGGFYYFADTKDSSGPRYSLLTIPAIGFRFNTATDRDATSRNLSGFGEARYHSGAFTVFAGGRLTSSRQRTRSSQQDFALVPTLTPTGPLLSNDLRYSDTDFSWRIGGQYQPNRNIMVYGTVSRGYKNAQTLPVLVVPSGPIVDRVALPEKPTAYEIGLKTTLMGGRLLFNIDGFIQNTKNLQAQTFVVQANTPVPALLPGNVSRVVSKGIEADATGRVGDHLTLTTSAIYNVAKYPSDYFDRNNVSLLGQQIAFAPRFAANFSGEYKTPLGQRVEGFLSLDGQYRSSVRLSDSFLDPTFTIDKRRFTFGGRIGARIEKAWSLALFANNITGTRIPTVLLPILPEGTGALYGTQAERQIGLQAQFEF